MASWTGLACTAAASLAAGCLLLPGLSQRSLQGDEGTYAAVALESNQASAVLPLRLHGQPFVNKPPLSLLIMRASLTLGGVSESSVRLPSALAGIATCGVLAGWLAVRCSFAAGLLGSLLLASAPGLLARSGWHGFRSGTTDAILVFLVMLAMIALLHSDSRLARAAAAAALAAATLTKGLAAAVFVVPVAVAQALAVPSRRSSQQRSSLRAGLVLTIASCLLPFMLWVACVESWLPGQALARLIDRDIVKRTTVGLNPRHVEGPLFYAIQLVEDLGWPTLALAVFCLLAWRRRRESVFPADWLLLWATLPVALASCAASKLPWYIYPSYPAWAALAAFGANEICRICRSRSRFLAMLALAGIGSLAAWRFAGAVVQRGFESRPTGMRTVADFLETHSHARLYWEPTLRFGEGGLTGGDYFYFLRFVDRSAPWRESADGMSCALVLTQPTGAEARARSGRGEHILALPRANDAYPEIFLVDRCGGRLAARLADSSTPHGSSPDAGRP